MSTCDRRIIDFRPAPDGWRLVYLADEEPAGFAIAPMPGWLILEEVYYSRLDTIDHDQTEPPADRPRAVVAAGCDGAELFAAAEAENFWLVLGPGDPEPSGQLVDEEKAARKEAPRREHR